MPFPIFILILFRSLLLNIWFEDQEYPPHWELVRNADLRPHSQPPESQSAFWQDPQVVHMLIRVWKGMLQAPDQFQGYWPWPADNDGHAASILGMPYPCFAIVGRNPVKLLPGNTWRLVEGMQRDLSFQRPMFPQKSYSPGVKLGLDPKSFCSESMFFSLNCDVSVERNAGLCVYDNSSFSVVWIFPHWLFYSITQFLEGENFFKKKYIKAWVESQDPAA